MNTWIFGTRHFLSSTGRGYEEACEYLDLWNKTLLIQHRALTCLGKSLAHILQRELYSMGNTGLLRREAEMTLLQPQLGETRHQELRNASFWPPSLFKSQLVKEGEDFLLKKAPQKTLRVSDPTRISPFVVPTRKEAPTGNVPPAGENQTSEAPGVVFDPIIGEEGVETPLPNDSSKASLSPPVGGRLRSFRRDWQTNKLGFYSRLFLIPKPHQRWRPVIDLSRPNTFLLIEKFKMETPESIRTSLVPGEWVSSINLSDAYHHIPPGL